MPELVDNGVEVAEIDKGVVTEGGPNGAGKAGNSEKPVLASLAPEVAAAAAVAAAVDRTELGNGKAAKAAETAGTSETPPIVANDPIPASDEGRPGEGVAVAAAACFFRCQDTMCIFMLPGYQEQIAAP